MKFIDLFAGIGGFRIAFEDAGFKAAFSCEKDPHCRRAYHANFNEWPWDEIENLTSDRIPAHDVLCAGFPCQPFSIAGVTKKNALGRKHGFQEEKSGNLFFELARILKEKRPRAFLLENVKNLLSHDRGNTYATIIRILHDLGYHMHHQVLNARSVLPQNRDRLFIAGFGNRKDSIAFEFPSLPDASPVLGGILEKEFDEKYILSDRLWKYLRAYKEKHRRAGNGFGYGLTGPDEVARTLTARYYKDGSEILVPVPGKNPRRLTPRECARLMGFPEDFQIVVSDTQAYRQFGNSVAVPVVEAIARSFAKALE
jgi:DNA (cytosine-5)-methyltransferase 1